MLLCLLDGLLRKGDKEGCASVPGFPLVHVVRAEEVAALSRDRVQGRLIEVGKIGGVALGRSEAMVRLFYREVAARLILLAGSCPAADDRQAAEDGMLNV